MSCSTKRHVDPELVGLSGGLFANAHLTAPVEPAPAAHLELPAPARPRRARRALWTVAIVAATLVAGGLAEARQAERSAAAPPTSPAGGCSPR